MNSTQLRAITLLAVCVSAGFILRASSAAAQQPAAVQLSPEQPATGQAAPKPAIIELKLQRRDSAGKIVHTIEQVDPRRVGVVVVDMWNWHWCKTSSHRVAALVPRMNPTLAAARKLGMQVFMCPSDVADNYVGFPQKESLEIVERKPVPQVREITCPPAPDGGGCTCGGERCPVNFGWDAMHPDLVMGEGDLMPNDQETLYAICQQKQLTHLIYMGVHTQICLLGKSIGLANMTRAGMHCILARDLTDAHGMYNASAGITPDSFTAQVVAHFEQHLAPTVDMFESMRATELLADDLIVDPVRIAPWGTPQRPHHFQQPLLATLTAPHQTSAAIHYTLDGSEPTAASPRYAEPLRIEATTHLRAVAMQGGKSVSLPSEAYFVLQPPAPPQPQVYLSDLKPLRAVGPGHSPSSTDHRFSPVSRPPQIDTNNRGEKIRLHGQEFARGIGVHAPNQLLYAVSPEHKRFVAQAGVDERILEVNLASNLAMHPSVVFKVFLDGKLAAESPVMKIGQRPWPFDVAIPSGTTLISLVATDAQDGNREDLANWADAGFICDETAAETAAWELLDVPGVWEEVPGTRHQKHDGFAWYRAWVRVPAEWKDQKVSLYTEAIDNSHAVLFNGKPIGGAGELPPQYRNAEQEGIQHAVPAELVRVGDWNCVAIRVFDEGGRGGFKGIAPVLMTDKQMLSLKGKWQFRPGDDLAWANADKPADAPAFDKTEGIEKFLPLYAGELAIPPERAVEFFEVPDDLELELLLAEPVVAQPVNISFDERGRLWVVQYLQYPSPAGLKIVSRDNYWRNVYDKVPKAPPHHERGADKITIHEDTDGDGKFDKHTTFVDGLSIATAVARGRGGVWVMNPPYLLFYPDQDNNDVPDADPEVHLSGFGLEDTHSVANSLRFGPDGWLYAAQGSTVSGNIRRVGIDAPDKPGVHSQGQLIWRYHPESRRYEIFAEGGGNAFGCEIDAKGRVFSGHNGGDTRGFHYVQGGYSQKGFSKHGPLSNPFAFGYFPAMKHPSVPRFTHEFVIYDRGSLPERYHGKMFGVAPLLNYVSISDVTPDGSSFQTQDIGFVQSRDQHFRPVDLKLGPDGALYIADWYDDQCAHGRNSEGHIQKDNGRIYRLKSKGAAPQKFADYNTKSSAELIELLKDDNTWVRQTALRLLGDRRDKAIVPQLETMLREETGQNALETLWALYQTAGLSEENVLVGLAHADPYVRAWTVRLECDDRQVSSTIARRIAELATDEPHGEVRSQLACSARRLPAAAGLAIVRQLLTHDADVSDIHLPLLNWWAIEAHCGSDPEAVLAMFEDRAVWNLPLATKHILPRVMQRFAATGSRKDLLVCARLLDLAPDKSATGPLMQGFEAAYKGRSLANLPEQLVHSLARSGGASLALRMRQGEAAALSEALAIIADEQHDATKRLEYVQVFAEVKHAPSVPVLLKAARESEDVSLRKAALSALQAYDAPEIAATVIELYTELPADVQSVAQSLLASRAAWALATLEAIDAGQIEPELVPVPVVRKMLLHSNERIAALVAEHWGDSLGQSPEQLRAEIARLASVVRSAQGNPYPGKVLFLQNCAKCHQLFEDGGKIGPDLTTYKRDDLDNMLQHIVEPSAEIREGFESFVALTSDGRTLNGFIADQDNQVVVLRGIDGENVVLNRDDIEVLRAVGRSIMPEGVLNELNDQQIRDLFAYLRSTQPLNN